MKKLALAVALVVSTCSASFAFAADDDWGPDTTDAAFADTTVWPAEADADTTTWGADSQDPTFADRNVWPGEDTDAATTLATAN